MRMDLPNNPSSSLLLSYLKHQRPFNSGSTKSGATPTMTGAHGDDYTRFEFKNPRKPFAKTLLDNETEELYERMRAVDPDLYTVRAFDTLLAWYDATAERWLITTVRAGTAGNMKRQAVRGALSTLELPMRVLALD